MYIFCVLWVNGAVFKGGDKIQVEIYIYILVHVNLHVT